jgi:signal transduction histidine kinase
MTATPNAERSIGQSTVLVIADDAEFARAVASRWQAERNVPLFTVMSGDLCPGINANDFDVAIVGAVRPGVLPSVLTILEAAARPTVFVAVDRQTAAAVRESYTRTLVIRQYEGWLDALVSVASEMLRAVQAVARACRAEQRAASAEAHATLGRYMLDMRHTLNNALTSVLGNAELLMLEPGILSAQAREQIDTIRNMAFRMNEILQRFSSLDVELQYVERQAAHEARAKAASAVGGVQR